MASQITSLEADKKAYLEQLDIVQTQLKDDAENAELLALKAELDDTIRFINETLAELQPKQPAAGATPPPAPKRQPTEAEDKHPTPKKVLQGPSASGAGGDDKDDAPPVSYQVNDEVLAKWLSGDKKFWPARITSITGSSTAPIYIVKFKSYKGTETLRWKDIRPVSNKRKADASVAQPTPNSSSGPTAQAVQPSAAAPGSALGILGTPTTTTTLSTPISTSAATDNGVVLSAAASLYQDANSEAEKQDGQGKPPRAKKIKAKKELEAGKNKWQEFNSKSKFAKSHKKESMFRTPDGLHGRVGFTGSGQAMRKDPTRSRHVYQMNEDAE